MQMPGKSKKIIIAPHYTVLNGNNLIQYSTFDKNLYFFLYLAEKYKDEVSFIYKPHPNIRKKVVETGMFKDYAAYDDYLRRWESLPNARVTEESTYMDIFRTSDGIIMDSASFIAEYLFVNKPGLYLTRPEQEFNPLGNRLMNIYYKIDGSDYTGIEGFVKDVIIEGKDTNRKSREAAFERELDYFKKSGCKAGEYMYKELCECFEWEWQNV